MSSERHSLARFLLALAGDGIQLAPHDLRRVALALRTGDSWNRQRLRFMLLALLVKNREQEEAFHRRFDSFFDRSEPLSTALVEPSPQVSHEVERTESSKTHDSPPISRRFKLWRSLAVAIYLATALGIHLSWLKAKANEEISRLTSPIQRLFIEPPILDFGDLATGSKAERPLPLQLENTGPIQEYIESVSISKVNQHADPHAFILLSDNCSNRTLRFQEVCTLTVGFQPQKRGLQTGRLTVATSYVVTTSDLSGRAFDSKRTYSQAIPRITDDIESPTEPSRSSIKVALGLFFLLGIISSWILLSRKPPQDRAPPWSSSRARHFRASAIGGQKTPFLAPDTLDQLASSMGLFLDERPGEEPDLAASIDALARTGGFPELLFQHPRRIRRVVILEDTQAEALAWNPIARELRSGLERRGIGVLTGRFTGVPDRFQTAEGTGHLEDLADDRRACLLFIFSDGRGLRRDRDRFWLEALARWPMVAWMEPREPRSWDQSTALPASFGIPIFAATGDGLLRAQGRFLSERGLRQESARQAPSWRGLPPAAAGVGLDVRVERALGDALPWAQACAMTLPPLSQNLAEQLRREFHDQLPRERFERLVKLPGTSRTVEGLHFSTRVLAILRRGFVVRRDRRQQEDVLRFLLDRIHEAEPKDPHSPAHQAWEWHLERVRLEIEPDRALKRLSQLAQGPLRRAIRGELAHTALEPQDDKTIPLRRKPRTRSARQRLWGLNRAAGITRRQAFQIRPQYWILLAVLAGLFLGSLVWAWFSVPRPSIELNLVGSAAQDQIVYWLEVRRGQSWERVEPDLRPSQWSVKQDEDYRLALFANGHGTLHPLGPVRQNHELRAKLISQQLPCREEHPAVGLTILRCLTESSPLHVSWRDTLGPAAPKDRLLSVGLEIGSAESGLGEPDISELLLANRSVDVIYRMTPMAGENSFGPALAKLRQDLGAWARRSQLIWWQNDDLAPNLTADLDRTIVRFDRRLALWKSSDPADPVGFARVFEPGKQAEVNESDITSAISTAGGSGNGEPVVLVRPVMGFGRVTIYCLLGNPGEALPMPIPLTFSRLGRNIPGKCDVELELAAGNWRVDIATTETYRSTGTDVQVEADGVSTTNLLIRPRVVESGTVGSAPPETGRVTVYAVLDGNRISSIPLRLIGPNETHQNSSGQEIEISAGRYRLQLATDAYTATDSIEITLEAGARQLIEVPIEAVVMDGRVTIDTVLDGVSIPFLNLEIVGASQIYRPTSGTEFTLPPGQYRVEVDSDEYLSEGLDLTLEAGGRFSRDLSLKRRPNPLRLQHSGRVTSIAFAPDGETLAVGNDREIKLWRISARSEALPINSLQVRRPVSSVAFSPDGRWLASGGNRYELRIWLGVTGSEESAIRIRPESGDILSLTFSPNSQVLAVGDSRGDIRFWDVETGEEAAQPLKRHRGGVFALAFSPDGRLLASGGTRSGALLWDWRAGGDAPEPRWETGFEDIYALRFSPGGDVLATGGDSGKIILLDQLKRIQNEQMEHFSTVYALDFSPQGDRIAAGDARGWLRLWDLRTGREILASIEDPYPPEKEVTVHKNAVTSVAFSADGRLLASGSRDRTVKVWQLERTYE